MSNMLRSLGRGLKILAASAATLSVLSYGYLQYINSIIGPLNVDKQSAIEFYKTHHKMPDNQASWTYYWVIYKISEARVLGFHTYSSYCRKLNSKIIQYSLENYERQHILQEIDKAGPLTPKNMPAHKKIYTKVQAIRTQNAANIQDRQYLIKGTMDFQKNFNSNFIPGISEETKEKVQKVYNYIKEVGPMFKDSGVSKKTEKMAEVQNKFEKDLLYKILML